MCRTSTCYLAHAATHTATHTRCNTLPMFRTTTHYRMFTLQHTLHHCNTHCRMSTLQHTLHHCNTHCTTATHTATHYPCSEQPHTTECWHQPQTIPTSYRPGICITPGSYCAARYYRKFLCREVPIGICYTLGIYITPHTHMCMTHDPVMSWVQQTNRIQMTLLSICHMCMTLLYVYQIH